MMIMTTILMTILSTCVADAASSSAPADSNAPAVTACVAQYLSTLSKMAETYNCAVFITNQVTADPGAAAMFGESKKPIGGHVPSFCHFGISGVVCFSLLLQLYNHIVLQLHVLWFTRLEAANA